jgi:hypothetical protein
MRKRSRLNYRVLRLGRGDGDVGCRVSGWIGIGEMRVRTKCATLQHTTQHRGAVVLSRFLERYPVDSTQQEKEKALMQ